jgi:pathogenesis-related protein 1
MLSIRCSLLLSCLWLATGSVQAITIIPDEIVSSHNSWRAQVGVPALKYSSELAKSAQAWADHLQKTNGCTMRHSDSDGKTGENLFWGSAWSNGKFRDISSRYVVDNWSDEKPDYDYARNTCTAGRMCGHYTQVVWSDTRRVGCGAAVCGDNSQVWVCHYEPAGNWLGEKPY